MSHPFDPSQAGAALLYDGTTGSMILGQGLRGKTTDIDRAKNAIGYFAYPNPRLKNQIPQVLFFEYERLARSTAKLPKPSDTYSVHGRLAQSVTRAAYSKKIEQIRKLLRAGEVYQINYAIRFRQRFSGDPYALFVRLTQFNPAAFSAYLNCGDFQIVSCSPERLFKAENGMIMTQPIKGTVKKITNYKLQITNKDNLEFLLNSEKERAELDMITDLERNDLGRVCDYGTVEVKKERAVMELPNLWHTYSEIDGKLRAGVKPSEIFQALFPGGSITGCPKIRAMEIIEKLERMPRNIFTGAIGYVSNGGSVARGDFDRGSHRGSDGGSNSGSNSGSEMDFNIAIRTLLIRDGMLEFWAGGGIVWDSDPEREYEECLLKAERILDTIKKG